jgi:CCR4-NOT transcription complex subunit 4
MIIRIHPSLRCAAFLEFLSVQTMKLTCIAFCPVLPVSPHPSPTPDPASARPNPAAAPLLLATDFPALPATAVSELPAKREQSQPYILPTPAKAPEPKVPSQPVIPVRKTQAKVAAKEAKSTARIAETTAKAASSTTPPGGTAGSNKTAKARAKQEKKEDTKAAPEPVAPASAPVESKKSAKVVQKSSPLPPPPEPIQAPLFSKVSKKAKPIQSKVIKVTKEDTTQTKSASEDTQEATSPLAPSQPAPLVAKQSVAEVSQNDVPASPAIVSEPSSLTDLLDHLSRRGLDVASLAFFNSLTLDPDLQTPLQYDPLVHALSALSVGGGSFANNLPPVSIDSAVSSFQQLLETVTQTISDLLRLLPRTTWDDSSSFDGVLRDMLKGDDFLDDIGEEGGKDDEVAALTLALERRARWMEVQLAKLEELHRDINTAAVRAVLTFNDRGWDPAGFMPRAGKSLVQFDAIGYVQGKGKTMRQMSLAELERASEKAKIEERAARHAVQESIEMMSGLLPPEEEE